MHGAVACLLAKRRRRPSDVLLHASSDIRQAVNRPLHASQIGLPCRRHGNRGRCRLPPRAKALEERLAGGTRGEVYMRSGRLASAREPEGIAQDCTVTLSAPPAGALDQQGSRAREDPLQVALNHPLAQPQLARDLPPPDPAHVEPQHGTLPRRELLRDELEQRHQLPPLLRALEFLPGVSRRVAGADEHARRVADRRLVRQEPHAVHEEVVHRPPQPRVDRGLVLYRAGAERAQVRLLEGLGNLVRRAMRVAPLKRSAQPIGQRPSGDPFEPDAGCLRRRAVCVSPRHYAERRR
jgi:hypothetical protein